MLALVLALQIAAQPTPAVAPAAPKPAQSQIQIRSPAPAADEPPPKTLEERLADLHVLWDQTCGNRAYGAYDDLCQNLGDEIHRAERQARKARLKTKPAPAPGGVPPAGPSPSVPPSVTARAAVPPAR